MLPLNVSRNPFEAMGCRKLAPRVKSGRGIKEVGVPRARCDERGLST